MALSRVRMEVDPTSGIGRRVWVTWPGQLTETEVSVRGVTIETKAHDVTIVSLRIAAIVTVVPEDHVVVDPDSRDRAIR